MKTFFTQPIGQLGRQNSLGFIGLNVVLVVVGFGEIDIPVGLGNFLNFLWGFSLFSIILAGYYLVKDQVPDYWREASAILGGVILVGTLIEISSPDYTLDNGGFAPMYILWAFNSLIYVLTMRMKKNFICGTLTIQEIVIIVKSYFYHHLKNYLISVLFQGKIILRLPNNLIF